ncbi:hypothetical protein DFJ73DRAFT_880077, partial [Zopfochytrium polystomum]
VSFYLGLSVSLFFASSPSKVGRRPKPTSLDRLSTARSVSLPTSSSPIAAGSVSSVKPLDSSMDSAEVRRTLPLVVLIQYQPFAHPNPHKKRSLEAFIKFFLFSPFQLVNLTISSRDIVREPAPIGAGSFGQVFRGTYQRHIPVAIKQLQVEATGIYPATRRELLAEARIIKECRTSGVSSPFVIGFYGLLVEDNGAKFSLVMEVSWHISIQG